ncbi:hypothetical protein EV193_103348 [Herbihabitans rhizosphaerae]|uniref:Secreted protein n=1 Tax=Herbihabitans rhizosphaerae TaxID=1872711 RepID=A0A4Q7KXI7_9PSEU|nr:hypothetical protein [Herbihabitans rhizosphaerae]RZS41030.1 hypothetical protein EV193_103348 [Herbihabitans rhizosphaerae]
MARKLSIISCLAAAAAVIGVFAGPASPSVSTETPAASPVEYPRPGIPLLDTREHSTDAAVGHGTRAEDIDAAPAASAAAPPAGAAGWPVPSRRSYYLTSSCQQHASAIRQGAAAWQGLTEGGGTPVECRNSYISDCGGGGRIVGCNWGQGQRIALYMGGVSDDALLAAHEFGHDWYGHSSYQCAGWSSAAHVMAPTMCNYRSQGDVK